MAWTTQRYHEWYNQNGDLCRLDFKEDAAATNTLIEAAQSPIKIIRPSQQLFEPIRMDGCQITLISQTDQELINMYTKGMMDVRIEFRIGGVMKWFGYQISEMYGEPYDQTIMYPVTIHGTRGFSLLDRIKFLDGSGDPYTGLKTQWDVLQIVLGYWGLMDLVSALWVGLSTTSSEITIGGTETILHHTYVSCHNYYDEDGEAWTCRQVLEDILKPYGAFIQFWGAYMLICDVNNMEGDITFKTYDNTFTWDVQIVSLAADVPDINTVGYYKTGSRQDIIPGVNRQVIRFSKYTPDSMDANIQDLDEMTFSVPLTEPQWTQLTTCGASSYLASGITGCTGWVFNKSSPYTISGAKEGTDGNPEYFLRINNPNGSLPYDENYYDDTHSTFTFDIPYVIGRDGFYIKIEGKIFPLTRTDPYVEEGSPCVDNADFEQVVILARLAVGSQLYRRDTKVWIAYPGTIQPEHQFRIYGGAPGEKAMNKWNNFRVDPWTHSDTKKHPVADDAVYIYVEPGVWGNIRLEFTEQIYAYVDGSKDDNESILIDEVFIKDLRVSVVTNPGFYKNNDDIEYVGELDQTWKNEGDPIVLNHGCSGVDGTPFDNGGLIYIDGSSDYHHFTEHTRGGQTDVIEKLLLNTVESNRESQTVKISASINNTSGGASFRYKDGTYMSGKMFMVQGSELDPTEGSEQIDIDEVIADKHTIS